jgi:bifunctional DNA-binding transcriptional regulator/antitoxin component of YhaV-PrlF toxin-antitoxin module
MNAPLSVAETRERGAAGFAVLDAKGRVSLPKAVRQALRVQAGAALDYAVRDGMLWLRPAPVAASGENGAAERGAARAVVDEKGRFSLGKAVRRALDVRPGSTLGYVLLDDAFLLIPQDDQLAALMERAAAALAAAGITTQDLLEDVPAARDAVLREAYGDAFMDDLAREYEALRGERERDEGAPRGV